MTQRAHINPDLLVWARETMNLSQDEAAQKIGVSEERLRMWEEGTAEPTIKQLRKASQVYKRPLAAFYLPKRPTDFHIPHDFRTVPDQRPLSPEFCAEFRKAVFRRRVAINCAGADVETSSRDIIGSASRDTSVRKVAEKTRALLAVPLDVQVSWSTAHEALNGWIAAAEYLGVLVFHFTGVAVDEVRGFVTCERPFPIIALNGGDSPAARVFTLVHEVVHLSIGEGGISDLKAVRLAVTQEQQVERFCNDVAGHCLVPRRPLSHWLQGNSGVAVDDLLPHLAQRFSVSRAVILQRLWKERVVTDDYFWATISHLSDPPPERETKRGPPVSRMALRAGGPLYTSVVLDAYDREAITSADLSEYLGARLKHVPDIREMLRSRLQTVGTGV